MDGMVEKRGLIFCLLLKRLSARKGRRTALCPRPSDPGFDPHTHNGSLQGSPMLRSC